MTCFDKTEKTNLCDILNEAEINSYLSDIAFDRALLKDIDAYCREDSKKLLAICGLRRTGKTILIMRQASNLFKEGKPVTYIQINRGDTQQKLFLTINWAIKNGSRFLFIDEITYIDGFARWADWVYNNTILKGVHCIIVGTDSFGLIIASNKLLYDRAIFVRTTHMPYWDYKRVTGNNLSEYIHTGGIFSKFEMTEYIDTSIASNIVDSINRYSDAGYKILDELDDDELRTVIIKTISRITIRFIIRLLTRKYKYPEIGSAKEIILQKFPDFVINNEDIIKHEVYKNLGLKEDLTRFSNKKLEQFLDYIKFIFETIDVVTKYDNISMNPGKNGYDTQTEYMLTQPALRFEQTMVYIRIIEKLDSTYQLLLQTILQNIEERLLKAVIMGETVGKLLSDCINESGKKYDVFKFSYLNSEIDMVILNCDTKVLHLFEIKRTSNVSSEQYKSLNNDEVLKAVQDVVYNRNPLINEIVDISKYILYSGMTQINVVDRISYINIEDYLEKLAIIN